MIQKKYGRAGVEINSPWTTTHTRQVNTEHSMSYRIYDSNRTHNVIYDISWLNGHCVSFVLHICSSKGFIQCQEQMPSLTLSWWHYQELNYHDCRGSDKDSQHEEASKVEPPDGGAWVSTISQLSLALGQRLGKLWPRCVYFSRPHTFWFA